MSVHLLVRWPATASVMALAVAHPSAANEPLTPPPPTRWFLIDRADLPLTLVRRSVPDIFLIAATASVLCIGWGLARTALTLQTMTQTERANGDRHALAR